MGDLIVTRYPLTDIQKGLLFHSLYNENKATYINQGVLYTNKQLDASLFKEAWENLIARHEILRTSFHKDDALGNEQHVHATLPCPFAFYDLEPMLKKDREAFFTKYLEEDRHTAFDFAKPPLMRLCLIKYSKNDCRFIWTHHHILLSGLSVLQLIKELFYFYGQLISSKSCFLPPVSTQRHYYDFLKTVQFEDAKEYWQNLLKDFTEPTNLAISVPNNNNANHQQIDFYFSPKLYKALTKFIKEHNLTYHTLFQAAWGLLLSVYSGSNDVVFGSVYALPRAVVKDIAGLFITTLPLRLQLAEITALEFIKNIYEQNSMIRKYIFTPLSKIQHWSNIKNGYQLFNSIINYYSQSPNSYLKSLSKEWKNRYVDFTVDTHYDITLELFNEGKEIRGRLNYSLKILDDNTAAQICQHFKNILAKLISSPTEMILNLNLFSRDEYKKIITDWNKTKIKFKKNQTLCRLIEKKAKENPQKIALISNNDSISYKFLNEKSNQLANYLKKIMMFHEPIIAVYLPRSIDTVVCFLAALKADIAYIPIDHNLPLDRIQHILESTQVSIVLTNKNLSAKFLNYSDTIKIIQVDDQIGEIWQQSKKNIPLAANENLAYVFFTSGSSGKPKGVQISHKALNNFLLAMIALLKCKTNDRFLALTSFAFDISALEIYLPLVLGAQCVIVPNSTYLNAKEIINILKKYKISVMQSTPATWHMLVEAGWKNNDKVKILCGGEALPSQLAKSLLLQGQPFWNLYGPTETTIWSTAYYVKDKDINSPITPIGKPIANTQVYILDQSLRPTPINVAGELYIGGIGVSSGYKNLPELTAKKFINNFFTNSEEKLYKTGDLVRWSPDGHLEYIKRIDDQIKLRGLRIEPGEIEYHLLEYPNIKQCIVTVKGEGFAEKRLIAYLVLDNEKQEIDFGTLRKYLLKQLPDYMVPVYFEILTAVPITLNGKIDRNSLPDPGIHTPLIINQYIAPISEEEKVLAQIWAKNLNIPLEQISIHDNFFDLGGHSYLAIRIISEINEKFNLDLSIRIFFHVPTIAKLWDYIAYLKGDQQKYREILKTNLEHQTNSPAILLRKGANKNPLFFMHPVGGTVFCYLPLIKDLNNEYTIYGFQDPSFEKGYSIFNSIEEMGSCYLEEIRKIQPNGPYLFCGTSFGATLAVEIAHQLNRTGITNNTLFLLDGWGQSSTYYHNKEKFKESMDRQRISLQSQLALEEIKNPSVWLDIQWHLMQLLVKYVPPKIVDNVILFKAAELLPAFQDIDDPLNHWGNFSEKKIKRHIVPGNHETILLSPNVSLLATTMNYHLNTVRLS